MNDGIRKLYSINEISIAALIGGPLAGFYLISRNFKALDKKSLSTISFVIGIIATIFLAVVIVFIPQDIMDKIPDVIIPALFTPVIYAYVKKAQGQEIKDHFKNGWAKHSQRRTAVTGVLALAITLASFFAIGKIAGSINVSAP
ncbi:MAG: hypothetical protein NTY14_02005 [Candidatus Omnitrophica bacterium]|nr:hypothetical protein [Candidatus Omnitrophota bacterium]